MIMALRKWERPFPRPLGPEDRFDRIIRDMFAGVRPVEKWPMHVEEYVEGDKCVIRLEIPGIDPDKDIDVEIGGGAVHVTARREERETEDRPDTYRSEFRYGSFERYVPLPEGATENDVTATYKDGILEVRLPLAPPVEKPTTTRVEVAHS
jgi:HSP20 family protein